MFQIRVHGREEGGEEAKAEEKDEEEEDRLFRALGGSKGGAVAAKEDAEPAQDASFLTGNPQVRVTTGKLRFYRPDSLPYAAGASSAGGLANQQLPIVRNTLVCIVSVPAHMPPVEILEFLAGFLVDISLVRILKDPERGNCMALMQFTTQDRADQFFLENNGKYFNSIEQERCKIVFVRSIEFDPIAGDDTATQETVHGNQSNPGDGEKQEKPSLDSDSEARKLFPLPPPGMTEIPTCAVCLDRLDASASGILTTLCNHTFHCDCLFRWEGSSCPVCRYSHGDIGSACEVCHTTDHLWICLICGHVGCGRYSGEHAKQHYQETLHTYSLELETQRVWDYAGDGYVHRLILNKQDGKFVEFPSLNNTSGERSHIPPPTSAEEQEGEHRKLEKLAVEYNFLLKSQLEEQRLYYERLLTQSHESESQQHVSALENEKKQLKKANATLAEKTKKLEEELSFVRELNKSLIENQKQWKERVQRLEEQNQRVEQETAMRVADLEGQVRDLMFYLDTQSKVEQSAHREEIMGGTLQIETQTEPPPPTQQQRSNRRKARGKR